MKNKFIQFTLVAVMLFGGVVATTPSVEAACSYNGYWHSSGKCEKSFRNEYRFNNYSYRTTYTTEYLQQYIRQLEALLRQLQALQHNGGGFGDSDVDVVTKSATDIDDEEATLRGEVDFNGEDEATVYFRWGSAASSLSKETTHVVLDEEDDRAAFEATITDLDEDKTYYFRAVAEDENGDRTHGAILSFRTDDDDTDDDADDDRPVATTDDADDVTDDSAELNGDVDMNDFEDGYVFFVYGEDEDQVSDVADDFDNYQDVDEDGDDLQKVAVDSDLDDAEMYTADISGLASDTEIFFALCVAFEDEDGDDVIVCGDTESFTTDDN